VINDTYEEGNLPSLSYHDTDSLISWDEDCETELVADTVGEHSQRTEDNVQPLFPSSVTAHCDQ